MTCQCWKCGNVVEDADSDVCVHCGVVMNQTKPAPVIPPRNWVSVRIKLELQKYKETSP